MRSKRRPKRAASWLLALVGALAVGCPGLQTSGVEELDAGAHATWVEWRYSASGNGSVPAASNHQFILTATPDYCDAIQAVQASWDQYAADLQTTDSSDCGPEGDHLARAATAMGPFSEPGQVTVQADVTPDEIGINLPAGDYQVGGDGPNTLRLFLTRHLANVPAEQLGAFDPDDPLCRDPEFEFTQPARELWRPTVAEIEVGARVGAGRSITLNAELASEDGGAPIDLEAEGTANYCLVDAGEQQVVGR